MDTKPFDVFGFTDDVVILSVTRNYTGGFIEVSWTARWKSTDVHNDPIAIALAEAEVIYPDYEFRIQDSDLSTDDVQFWVLLFKAKSNHMVKRITAFLKKYEPGELIGGRDIPKYGSAVQAEWTEPTTSTEQRMLKLWREGLRTSAPAKPDLTPQDELGLQLEVGRSYKNQKGDTVRICEEVIVPSIEERFFCDLGFTFRDETGMRYRPNGSARPRPDDPADRLYNLTEEIDHGSREKNERQ